MAYKVTILQKCKIPWHSPGLCAVLLPMPTLTCPQPQTMFYCFTHAILTLLWVLIVHTCSEWWNKLSINTGEYMFCSLKQQFSLIRIFPWHFPDNCKIPWHLPSLLWFAFSALTWLVGEQEGHPACKNEWRDAGVVICRGREGEEQICIWEPMSLPLTVSCFSKSRLVLHFWYWLIQGVPDKGSLNGLVNTYCIL